MSRLSPIFPLNHLSYIFGATECQTYDYIKGTALGVLPGVIAYCYMGSKIKDMSEGGIDIGMVVTVIGTIFSIFVISKKANAIIQKA